MTADDYRATLSRLGLTQGGAARLLGVTPRASRSWALGERAIPGPAVAFLRYLEAVRTLAPRVHARALERVDL
jgi:DNA-binding transcriptional regulator YiaG